MQGLRQSARPYAVTYAIILEVVEFYNVQDRQVNQSMFKPLFVRHPGGFFGGNTSQRHAQKTSKTLGNRLLFISLDMQMA